MKEILSGTVDRDASSDYLTYRSIVELILAAIRLPADCHPTLHIGRMVVAKDNKRGCRLIRFTERGINIGINPGLNCTDDGFHRFCYIELPCVNSEKVFIQLTEKWGDQNFDPRPKEERSPKKSLRILVDRPRGEAFDPRLEGGKRESDVEVLPPGMAEDMRQVFQVYPSPTGSFAKPQTRRPSIYDEKGPSLFSPMGSCYLSPEELAKQELKGRPKTEVQDTSSVPEERLLPPPAETLPPLVENAPPEEVVVQTPPQPPSSPPPPPAIPKPPTERKDGQMIRGNKKGSKHEKNRYTIASENPENFSKILSFAVRPIGAYELRKEVDKVMPWKGEVEDKRQVFAFIRFMKLQLLKKGYLEKAPGKSRMYIISEKSRKFISDHSGGAPASVPPAPPSGANAASESAPLPPPPPAPQLPATTSASDGVDWKGKYDELKGRYGIICIAVKRLINNEEEIGTRKKVRRGLLAVLEDLIPSK